ncbi:amidohydrolase [Sphingobacterium hungaricum]|uniref:Amidohydrolase n=1 Tax=Sphingobacterium hungaricum TaxID=2082723 RepID=A0A928YPW9_9SPHI|nr:amidohydrolase [Sphingobacterium hungaricum]MBE8713606.1 amidohydrolase [Sphingobacterium hungaricum]
MRISILFLSVILFFSCTTNKEVDLIVYNAKVYTVDSAFSTVDAFAINNGVFIELGESEDLLQKYNAKEKIDAQQKAVYPGFYDSHVHFFGLANLIDEVDLKGSASFEEVIERLQDYHKAYPDKKWLVAGGWDQNLWADKNYPTKDSLDKYFPEVPVFLSRVDYHAAVVNTKALHLATLDSAYVVEGGFIAVDSLGKPNGLLIDNAVELVAQYIPIPEEKALYHMLRKAQDSLVSVGLTSIVDAGLSDEEIDILKKFYNQDSLQIRNYAMLAANPENINRVLRFTPFESEKLTIKSVKLMADGALGSRGACLLSDYSDEPTKGFLLYSPQELDNIIRLLANSSFQVSTHAIGDSANRVILDLYGKYIKDKPERRWRIEHAQVVDSADFSKFKLFSIIPSVQPVHATSDMYWAEERLGEKRIKYAYAYKELLNQYGKLALGSDFPVEHFNPLYGFHAAVARVDDAGFPKGGFQPENAISREDALRGMTIWAAYSCFQEKKRGSIEKGKDADFVILDDDIMQVAAEKLRSVKTLRTVIAGETVFLRN